MPFTPSHAVVALPFRRTPLVPAAVAVGAMTPDLPLFVRGTFVSYGWTHDLRWIPVTIVLAAALLLVWRLVLRPAARELAPDAIARRLPAEWDGPAQDSLRETFPSARGTALLTLALAIGVASHIVWDLFTHEGRSGVLALPLLGAAWGPVPGYTWLQHGSSALGLLVLAGWAVRRLHRTAAGERIARLLPGWVRVAWWMSLPVALALAAGAGYAARGPFTSDFTWQHLAYAVLPPACAVWGAVTVALCLVVVLLRRR